MPTGVFNRAIFNDALFNTGPFLEPAGIPSAEAFGAPTIEALGYRAQSGTSPAVIARYLAELAKRKAADDEDEDDAEPHTPAAPRPMLPPHTSTPQPGRHAALAQLREDEELLCLLP